MRNHITREQAKENVGTGWAALIDDVYDRLPTKVCVTQVKEKMGSLRIYVKDANDSFYDYLQEVQDRSAIICEICGEPGELRGGSWRKTLCDVHILVNTLDII